MGDPNYSNNKEYLTYTLEDGSKYEGEELNGLRHGFGAYIWPEGERYVGNWKDGKKDGFGVYYWPNGDRYEGNWINGLRHGKGTVYYTDGSERAGEWENGNYIDGNSCGENDNDFITVEETNLKQTELDDIYISWDDDLNDEEDEHYEDQDYYISKDKYSIFSELDDGHDDIINSNPNSTLINMASLEFYKDNLFRVFGQSVIFTEQDLTREAKKIKKQLKLGIPLDSELSIKLPKLPYEKNSFDENSINDAIQRLRNPKLRLLDELFWFWPAQDEESFDDGLNALREADFLKAHRIWTSANFANDYIAIHNLAVLTLYRVLLMESYESIRPLTENQAVIKFALWDEVYKNWRLVISNDSIWRHIENRIDAIDHPSLDKRIVNEFRDSIMLFLVNINTKLALAAARKGIYKVAEKHRNIIERSGLKENIIEKVIVDKIKDIIDSIKDSCDKANREAQNNYQFGLKISLSLHDEIKDHLLIIKHLLTEESQIYISSFQLKKDVIHTLIEKYFINMCEKTLEESENKPSRGNEIAVDLHKRSKNTISRVEHLKIDDILVETVFDIVAFHIYQIIALYYKETGNDKSACIILEKAFEIATDNTIKESIRDAIKSLSISTKCCFCKTNDASENAAGESLLGRHKIAPVMPVEDNFEAIKLKLPRCPQCKELHNKKKNNYAYIYSIWGLIIGFVSGFFLFLDATVAFTFTFFGAGIGFFLGDKKNLNTIRDLNYVNCSDLDFEPLNELKKEGWIILKE